MFRLHFKLENHSVTSFVLGVGEHMLGSDSKKASLVVPLPGLEARALRVTVTIDGKVKIQCVAKTEPIFVDAKRLRLHKPIDIEMGIDIYVGKYTVVMEKLSGESNPKKRAAVSREKEQNTGKKKSEENIVKEQYQSKESIQKLDKSIPRSRESRSINKETLSIPRKSILKDSSQKYSEKSEKTTSKANRPSNERRESSRLQTKRLNKKDEASQREVKVEPSESQIKANIFPIITPPKEDIAKEILESIKTETKIEPQTEPRAVIQDIKIPKKRGRKPKNHNSASETPTQNEILSTNNIPLSNIQIETSSIRKEEINSNKDTKCKYELRQKIGNSKINNLAFESQFDKFLENENSPIKKLHRKSNHNRKIDESLKTPILPISTLPEAKPNKIETKKRQKVDSLEKTSKDKSNTNKNDNSSPNQSPRKRKQGRPKKKVKINSKSKSGKEVSNIEVENEEEEKKEDFHLSNKFENETKNIQNSSFNNRTLKTRKRKSKFGHFSPGHDDEDFEPELPRQSNNHFSPSTSNLQPQINIPKSTQTTPPNKNKTHDEMPWPNRTTRNTYRVLFSDIKVPMVTIQTLKSFGLSILEDKSMNFNILVLPNINKRSIKLLLAINKGAQIVNYNWVEACLSAGKIMSPEAFSADASELEAEFDFSLKNSQKKAMQGNGFLEEKYIWMPPDIDPDYDSLCMLVESAGGMVVQVLTGLENIVKDDILPILDKKNFELAEEIKRHRIISYSIELLLMGCLKQELILENFEIK